MPFGAPGIGGQKQLRDVLANAWSVGLRLEVWRESNRQGLLSFRLLICWHDNALRNN
jgi:hypothetical protein